MFNNKGGRPKPHEKYIVPRPKRADIVAKLLEPQQEGHHAQFHPKPTNAETLGVEPQPEEEEEE